MQRVVRSAEWVTSLVRTVVRTEALMNLVACCCRQGVEVRRARVDGICASGTTSAGPQQYRLFRGLSHDGQNEHAEEIRRQNQTPPVCIARCETVMDCTGVLLWNYLLCKMEKGCG